jgi:hypothetical protein
VKFEWDERKNRTNRAKHGMDFSFARLAFDDPFSIILDERETDGEQRYQLIGSVFARVILVAHAMRYPQSKGAKTDEEAIVRIISARKATRAERKLYEEDTTN